MCVKVEPTYYRLELDDYSAAAFTSFGKYYYGTLEDLRCFFGELAHDEKLKKQFKELLSTFQAFEEGQQDLSHSIAYRKVPFLVPVQLLHREPVTLENYKWTHISGLPATGNTAVQPKLCFQDYSIPERSAGGIMSEQCFGDSRAFSPETHSASGIDWLNRKSSSRPKRTLSEIGSCSQRIRTPTIRSFAMTSLEMADV